MQRIKKIIHSVIIISLTKLAGLIRESVFIWRLGINELTSLVMMTNVIPAAISMLMRYASINIAIHLKLSLNLTSKEVNNQIGIIFASVILIAVVPSFFYWYTNGLTYLFIYFIYLLAALIYAVIGLEEFTLLASENKSIVAYAAMLGTFSSIVFIILTSSKFGSFALPVATFISAILNYYALPKRSDRFMFDHIGFNKTILLFRKAVIVIAPILIIELIGMTFGLVDYFIIIFYDLPKVSFQYNYYASLIYNLPIMIIGLALGSEIFKNGRSLLLLEFIKKNSLLSVSSIWICSYIIFLSADLSSQLLLTSISDKISDEVYEKVLNVSSLFTIYATGIIPAISVYLFTKLLLANHESRRIAFVYSFGLLAKVAVSFFVCILIEPHIRSLPISTVSSWLALLTILIFLAKHEKF